MSKAARARTEARRHRRERFFRQFPTWGPIIEDRAFALMFLATAPFARLVIEEGLKQALPVTPDLGVENHDAMVSLVKDRHGLLTLSDAEFEAAMRLATPPECREPLQ